MKYDLSIIICSTDLIQAKKAAQTVVESSGCKCEILIHDNTMFKWSLSKTYNTYARLASSEVLLFMHQDVEVYGEKWFKEIRRRLSSKDVGAIGFAGSTLRIDNCYYGWLVNLEYSINNCSYRVNGHKLYKAEKVPFQEAVVADGLALLCRRDSALKFPFDEKNIEGFHCYDIDFTMTLNINKLHNYIYTGDKIQVIHKSPGKYGAQWAVDTMKIMKRKWLKYKTISLVDISEEKIDELRDIKNMEFVDILRDNLTREDFLQAVKVAKLGKYIRKCNIRRQKNRFDIRLNGYEDWK